MFYIRAAKVVGEYYFLLFCTYVVLAHVPSIRSSLSIHEIAQYTKKRCSFGNTNAFIQRNRMYEGEMKRNSELWVVGKFVVLTQITLTKILLQYVSL